MRRSTLLFLASVTLFVTFLGLEPLLTFPVWGSDSGEYYVLTSYLLDHGQFLRTGYAGNGFGYPYFPGMFEVGAAVAGATGADPLASLLVTVPVLGALSILPLFLLFRRFYPHDGVAILGAALAGAVFPRLFSLSHAAPLTMGDLFVVASLWMFVEQRKDPRWLLPLGLTLFALIATHHFSSYIFFITATGGLALFELYAPGRWAKRFPAREFGVLGAFVVSLFTYWFLYAPPFADRILPQGVEGRVPSIALPVAAVGVLALLALGVYWSRRSRGTTGSFRIPRLRWPSLGKLIRDPLIVGLLMYGGLATLLVVPIPGTHQTATPLELVYYSPFVLLGPLSAANRRFASFSPLGYIPWFILATVGASAAFGLVTANPVLLPARHVEYLAIPLAFFSALALGRLVQSYLAQGRGQAAMAVTSVALLLVAANAAVAFPPPVALGGFEEGFTVQDVAMVTWMAREMAPGSVLAADYRLSDLYFGFSGNPATWSNAGPLFLSPNRTAALQQLAGTRAPSRTLPIDLVAVDATMRTTGVALNPSSLALPMASQALTRFSEPPFVVVYENGPQEVWWVDG